MEKLKFFLYARKSTNQEDKQILSLESQIQELKILAKRLNIQVVDVITESQSAKAPGREKFNKMLDEIEAKKANAILTWKIDRLSRNPIDTGRISWLLQRGIIKQIQTYSHCYLPSDNVLLMSVETGMANQYLIDLSSNVSRGMKTKASQGWLPNKSPAGYLNNPTKNAPDQIIPDPERWDVVRSIFDMYLSQRYTAAQIINKVNEEFKLRTMRRGREGDKLLTASKFYWILKHPFYYGMVRWNKELYQGKHRPMVTISEFNRVQELLNQEGKARPHKKKFDFTGMIRCEVCGMMITADEKHKAIKSGGIHKYIYYRCTRKNPRIKCEQPAIREKELVKQIKEKFADIYINPKTVQLVLRDLKIMHDEEKETQNSRLDSLQRVYKNTQNQITNLLSVRLEGLITDEEYKQKKNQLMNEKLQLEEKLRDNSGRVDDWLTIAEKAMNFAAHAGEWFKKGTLEDRKLILQTFGSNFYLKDKNLHAEIREPFLNLKKTLTGLSAEVVPLELNKTAVRGRERSRKLTTILTGWAQ